MKIQTLKQIIKKNSLNEQFAIITNLSNGSSEIFKVGSSLSKNFINFKNEIENYYNLKKSGVINNTEIFIENYFKPVEVIIVGAVHITQYLIEFLKNLNFDKELNIPKQFSKIINDFPDSKWEIKNLKSNIPNKNILRINVSGEKIVDGEIHKLESNFDYLFSIVNGKINEGIINNLFTTIRNDENKIDISFKIPDKVLTGSTYDIDIILNKPLEEV